MVALSGLGQGLPGVFGFIGGRGLLVHAGVHYFVLNVEKVTPTVSLVRVAGSAKQ